MHDAAVRVLNANTNADAAEQALLAIGLTGGKGDYSLLEKFYENNHPTDVWNRKLRNASEASLARLGNEEHLKNIENELRPSAPAVLMNETAEAINNAIEKAAFSNNRRFVPLLCRHLKDPYPKKEVDVMVLSPGRYSAQALDQLINHASPEKQNVSIEEWEKKCLSEVSNK